MRDECTRALAEYRRIFGHAAGAPGWQATANSRQVYDEAGLFYASDTRGESALFPEIEAMMKRPLFRELKSALADKGVRFVRMDDLAREILAHRETIPVQPLVMAEIDGRSGLVATQG